MHFALIVMQLREKWNILRPRKAVLQLNLHNALQLSGSADSSRLDTARFHFV